MRQSYGDSERTVWVDHDGVLRETDKAYLLQIDNEEIWLPKSQVIDIGEEQVGLKPWIAEQKGLKGDW
jgi:hypothetical protein